VLRFFTADNPKVKQIQRYIHNISSIMDCIECEKCRLFGKMQTYGIGTALKILLGYPTPYKRNEIVALFNVFNKITMSVETYYKYRTEAIEFGFESPSPRYL
jgi:ERO1-like protein alpha